MESLEEWAATKRALDRVYGINEIILKSLSPKEARLDLVFQGDPSRLRLALQQADMTLSQPRGPSAGYYNQGYQGGMTATPVYDLYLNRYGRQPAMQPVNQQPYQQPPYGQPRRQQPPPQDGYQGGYQQQQYQKPYEGRF